MSARASPQSRNLCTSDESASYMPMADASRSARFWKKSSSWMALPGATSKKPSQEDSSVSTIRLAVIILDLFIYTKFLFRSKGCFQTHQKSAGDGRSPEIDPSQQGIEGSNHLRVHSTVSGNGQQVFGRQVKLQTIQEGKTPTDGNLIAQGNPAELEVTAVLHPKIGGYPIGGGIVQGGAAQAGTRLAFRHPAIFHTR